MIIHHSSFVIRSFIIHRSSFVIRSFVIYHSSYVRSLFSILHSSFVHSSFVIRSFVPPQADHSVVHSFIIRYPPNPAKPINERDKMPPTNKTSAVPFTIPMVSENSSCSLKPAIRTSASVNPAPAPSAYTKL